MKLINETAFGKLLDPKNPFSSQMTKDGFETTLRFSQGSKLTHLNSQQPDGSFKSSFKGSGKPPEIFTAISETAAALGWTQVKMNFSKNILKEGNELDLFILQMHKMGISTEITVNGAPYVSSQDLRNQMSDFTEAVESRRTNLTVPLAAMPATLGAPEQTPSPVDPQPEPVDASPLASTIDVIERGLKRRPRPTSRAPRNMPRSRFPAPVR